MRYLSSWNICSFLERVEFKQKVNSSWGFAVSILWQVYSTRYVDQMGIIGYFPATAVKETHQFAQDTVTISTTVSHVCLFRKSWSPKIIPKLTVTFFFFLSGVWLLLRLRRGKFKSQFWLSYSNKLQVSSDFVTSNAAVLLHSAKATVWEML